MALGKSCCRNFRDRRGVLNTGANLPPVQDGDARAEAGTFLVLTGTQGDVFQAGYVPDSLSESCPPTGSESQLQKAFLPAANVGLRAAKKWNSALVWLAELATAGNPRLTGLV